MHGQIGAVSLTCGRTLSRTSDRVREKRWTMARPCAESMTGAQPLRSSEHGVLRHGRRHHQQEACTAPRCMFVTPRSLDVSADVRFMTRGQVGRRRAVRLARLLASTVPETLLTLTAFFGSFRGPASCPRGCEQTWRNGRECRFVGLVLW